MKCRLSRFRGSVESSRYEPRVSVSSSSFALCIQRQPELEGSLEGVWDSGTSYAISRILSVPIVGWGLSSLSSCVRRLLGAVIAGLDARRRVERAGSTRSSFVHDIQSGSRFECRKAGSGNDVITGVNAQSLSRANFSRSLCGVSAYSRPTLNW